MSQQQSNQVDQAAIEALAKADFTDIQQPLRQPGALITPAQRLERLIGASKNTLAEMRVVAGKLAHEYEKQVLGVDHEFKRAHDELDVAHQNRLRTIEEEYLKACKPVEDLIELCKRVAV